MCIKTAINEWLKKLITLLMQLKKLIAWQSSCEDFPFPENVEIFVYKFWVLVHSDALLQSIMPYPAPNQVFDIIWRTTVFCGAGGGASNPYSVPRCLDKFLVICANMLLAVAVADMSLLNKSMPVGPVAGGIMGCFLLLALGVYCYRCYSRRRSHQCSGSLPGEARLRDSNVDFEDLDDANNGTGSCTRRPRHNLRLIILMAFSLISLWSGCTLVVCVLWSSD